MQKYKNIYIGVFIIILITLLVFFLLPSYTYHTHYENRRVQMQSFAIPKGCFETCRGFEVRKICPIKFDSQQTKQCMGVCLGLGYNSCDFKIFPIIQRKINFIPEMILFTQRN